MDPSRENIQISVRNLVSFLLRNGDIDNRITSFNEDAMQEGARIHRMIQKSKPSDYQAEVTLKYLFISDLFSLQVDGRADGIQKLQDKKVLIDEIKGTYRDFLKLTEPDPLHLAQAKCYGAMYAFENDIEELEIQITYCNLDTEALMYFKQTYLGNELKEWFLQLLKEYEKWAILQAEWNEIRNRSIKALEFPFPYRKGQKELIVYGYQTIYHRRKLFLEAPTGVGKTLSTLFPGVKALGEKKIEKIFYLTAKTITASVAQESLSLLRKNGLRFRSILLTAKEKVCFLEEAKCNPLDCPYAKGHFDRINDVIFKMITEIDCFTRECVSKYAFDYRVCPFELSLDLSLFCDGIIGDYNYLFDPYVSLKRFFTESGKRDYLFLIDEAHNLLERGRQMYSAELIKEDFLATKHLINKDRDKGGQRLIKALDRSNKELLHLKKTGDQFQMLYEIEPLIKSLLHLNHMLSDFIEDNPQHVKKEDILDFFFLTGRFLDIYERVDDKYVMYSEITEDAAFHIKLFNVDPSENLMTFMNKGRATILFSATLLPIQYYKKLLGGTQEDYEVYAESVFQPDKRGIFIGNDVSSRYKERSILMYEKIAAYIHNIVKVKKGNYMVFFPSYQFMRQVEEEFQKKIGSKEDLELICQKEKMSEEQKEEFLAAFQKEQASSSIRVAEIDMEIEVEHKNILAFCVMGGMFSEGIDLTGDMLIGSILVGTGLPQICNEREVIREYFDEKEKMGFEYAYQYPGMNKVLQSAGRVIRTSEDIGVVVLLDERFYHKNYQALFPREWEEFHCVELGNVKEKINDFWEQW